MKLSENSKYAIFLLGVYFLLSISSLAQDSEIIEIGNVYSGEIEFGAFELLEKSTIHIEGNVANFGGTFNKNQIFYGWIINSDTRHLVWDVKEVIDFEDAKGMYSINEDEQLDTGKYEVYYTSIENSSISINSFDDFISRVFSSSKSRFKKKYRSKLGITVSGEEEVFYEIDPVIIVDSLVKNSIISFLRVRNDENLNAGFSLKDNTSIRIYSVGESRKSTTFDIAWITNVKTNKIVWKATNENSSYAGGGNKNYFVDEDQQNVIPFREEDIVKPIVELTKVGDDEFLSQGFTLGEATELNLLCLGEGRTPKKLRDYGWLIDADTKEIKTELPTIEDLELATTKAIRNAEKNDKNENIE